MSRCRLNDIGRAAYDERLADRMGEALGEAPIHVRPYDQFVKVMVRWDGNTGVSYVPESYLEFVSVIVLEK